MSSVLGGFAGLGGPSIGRAVVDMVLDAKAYNAELAATEARTAGATKSMGTGFSGFQKSVTSSFSKAQIGMVAFGAVAAIAITKAVGATQEWAAEVRTLQRVTGTSAEATSALGAAGKLLNLDMQKLNTGFGLLGKSIINESANLTKYGVELKDAQGNVLPFDEVLGNLSDKFLTLEKGPEQAAFAMNVFGRSGKELIPVLARGSAGLEELKQKAADAGLVMSQDTLDASKDLGIAQRELGDAVQGAGVKLGTAFLPVLKVVAESLTVLVELVQLIPTPVLAIGAAFGVITAAIIIARKAWVALQATMSGSIGVMGAWVLAAAAVVVAAQKVQSFLKMDDEAAKGWNEQLKANKFTLGELRTAVQDVTGETGFSDKWNGDQTVLDAFNATAKQTYIDIRALYADALPNATNQSQGFADAMIASEAFTMKQNAAVAELIRRTQEQGLVISRATGIQIEAAIAAGDYQDVVHLLGNELGDAYAPTGALGDATRDLAGQQREAARAAAEHTQKLIDLRRTELDQAGGILGLVSASRSLSEAQKTVNDLRKQGKTDSAEYADALEVALGAELTLKGAVLDVTQDVKDHKVSFDDARDQLINYGVQAGLTGDDLRRFVNDSLRPVADQMGIVYRTWQQMQDANPVLQWMVHLEDNFDLWMSQLNAKLAANGIGGFGGGGSGTGRVDQGVEGSPTPKTGNREASTSVTINGDVYTQDGDQFTAKVNDALRRTADRSVLI